MNMVITRKELETAGMKAGDFSGGDLTFRLDPPETALEAARLMERAARRVRRMLKAEEDA